MDDSTQSDRGPVDPGSPSNPSVEQMNSWTRQDLLQWIQQKRPDLLIDENLDKFRAAKISGAVFLSIAGEVDSFMETELPLGICTKLADLALQVKEGSSQTASRKRKCDETNSPQQPFSQNGREVTPESHRPRPGTEHLPTIPTVDEMKSWGWEKVLQWVQQREPDLLKDDNLDNFKKADMMGRAFLLASAEFYVKYCSLTPDVSLELEGLMLEVKEGCRLSREHPLKLAAKARERRKRITKIITDMDDFPYPDSLPGAVDELADPTVMCTLPFPFVGAAVPHRFKLDDTTANWTYVGRVKFKELVKHLKNVQNSYHYSRAWFYGTEGYGKSHLLAALVCYLAAQNERVVYIPDCRMLLRDPVGCVRTAMLFAWANDIPSQKEITKLDTQDKIDSFLTSRKYTLVVDEVDVLRTSYFPEEGNEGWKQYRWLLGVNFGNNGVFCSSSNDREHWALSDGGGRHSVLQVHGGLTRMEMDQWWEQHSDVEMGDYDRSDVEDTTGCIPLLLDRCVIGGRIDLNLADLHEMYHEAAQFALQVRDRTMKDEHDWQWYCEFMGSSFFQNCEYTISNHKLVDHRYFYWDLHKDDFDHGYTCGVVRNAVADRILEVSMEVYHTSFLSSLVDFISTPPIAEYVIKYAVLFSIRLNGLAIGMGIGKSVEVRLLTVPANFLTDVTDKPMLYRLKTFDFKTVDGIIVWVTPSKANDAEGERPKLFMVPLHITSAASPTISHAKFFEKYREWTPGLSNFDVEIEFLWITPERRDIQWHPSSAKWPAHKERYVPFEDVNEEIWEKYQQAKRAENADR